MQGQMLIIIILFFSRVYVLQDLNLLLLQICLLRALKRVKIGYNDLTRRAARMSLYSRGKEREDNISIFNASGRTRTHDEWIVKKRPK